MFEATILWLKQNCVTQLVETLDLIGWAMMFRIIFHACQPSSLRVFQLTFPKLHRLHTQHPHPRPLLGWQAENSAPVRFVTGWGKFDMSKFSQRSKRIQIIPVCNNTTWKIDGTTPMYWFIMAPYQATSWGLRHLLSLRCNETGL